MYQPFAVALAFLLLPGAAHAQPQLPLNDKGELTACPTGLRVLDRQDRAGTIASADGSTCVIRGEDGATRHSLSWMLRPAAAMAQAQQGGAGLEPGTYVCSATGAGIFRVTIAGGAAYESAGTSGTYSVSGRDITFASGSLAGQYGRIETPTKFGLSTAPTRRLYTMCNKRDR